MSRANNLEGDEHAGQTPVHPAPGVRAAGLAPRDLEEMDADTEPAQVQGEPDSAAVAARERFQQLDESGARRICGIRNAYTGRSAGRAGQSRSSITLCTFV